MLAHEGGAARTGPASANLHSSGIWSQAFGRFFNRARFSNRAGHFTMWSSRSSCRNLVLGAEHSVAHGNPGFMHGIRIARDQRGPPVEIASLCDQLEAATGGSQFRVRTFSGVRRTQSGTLSERFG